MITHCQRCGRKAPCMPPPGPSPLCPVCAVTPDDGQITRNQLEAIAKLPGIIDSDAERLHDVVDRIPSDYFGSIADVTTVAPGVWVLDSGKFGKRVLIAHLDQGGAE